MTNMLPSPILHTQLSRYSSSGADSDWRVTDMQVGANGGLIAISGINEGNDRISIELFKFDVPDFKKDPKILYSREFECGKWYRFTSLFGDDHRLVVTCCGDQLALYNTEDDAMIREHQISGVAWCMTVKKRLIYVGIANLHESGRVGVFDDGIRPINMISLPREDGSPRDISVMGDHLFVRTGSDKPVMYNHTGDLLAEFPGPEHNSRCRRITVSAVLSLVIVSWTHPSTITVHSLSEGTGHDILFNIPAGDCDFIRVPNLNRLDLLVMTGWDGDVTVFNMGDLFTFDNLKKSLCRLISGEECSKLKSLFTAVDEEINCMVEDATDNSDGISSGNDTDSEYYTEINHSPSKDVCRLLTALHYRGLFSHGNIEVFRMAVDQCVGSPHTIKKCLELYQIFAANHNVGPTSPASLEKQSPRSSESIKNTPNRKRNAATLSETNVVRKKEPQKRKTPLRPFSFNEHVQVSRFTSPTQTTNRGRVSRPRSYHRDLPLLSPSRPLMTPFTINFAASLANIPLELTASPLSPICSTFETTSTNSHLPTEESKEEEHQPPPTQTITLETVDTSEKCESSSRMPNEIYPSDVLSQCDETSNIATTFDSNLHSVGHLTGLFTHSPVHQEQSAGSGDELRNIRVIPMDAPGTSRTASITSLNAVFLHARTSHCNQQPRELLANRREEHGERSENSGMTSEDSSARMSDPSLTAVTFTQQLGETLHGRGVLPGSIEGFSLDTSASFLTSDSNLLTAVPNYTVSSHDSLAPCNTFSEQLGERLATQREKCLERSGNVIFSEDNNSSTCTSYSVLSTYTLTNTVSSQTPCCSASPQQVRQLVDSNRREGGNSAVSLQNPGSCSYTSARVLPTVTWTDVVSASSNNPLDARKSNGHSDGSRLSEEKAESLLKELCDVVTRYRAPLPTGGRSNSLGVHLPGTSRTHICQPTSCGRAAAAATGDASLPNSDRSLFTECWDSFSAAEKRSLLEYQDRLDDRDALVRTLTEFMFTEEERRTQNCQGKSGFQKLNPNKLNKIRLITFHLCPINTSRDSERVEKKEWSRLCAEIDSANRHFREKLKRQCKQNSSKGKTT